MAPAESWLIVRETFLQAARANRDECSIDVQHATPVLLRPPVSVGSRFDSSSGAAGKHPSRYGLCRRSDTTV